MQPNKFFSIQRYHCYFSIVLLFSLLWAMCLIGLFVSPASAQTADILDVNAQIHVLVVGQPDISGDYKLDHNGDIAMLYVKQIHVAGLTLSQAEAKITEALGKFYRSPQVQVTLLTEGTLTVSVTGAVTKPGPNTTRSGATLNDLMQMTGWNLDADLSHLKITHGSSVILQAVDTVDYRGYLDRQEATGNPVLHDGDQIYVPRKDGGPIEINLRGEFIKAGLLTVPARTRVYDALQTAGGLTPTADKDRIIIERNAGTIHLPFDYEAARMEPESDNANPLLQDGDAVVVPALERTAMYTLTGGVQKSGEFPIMGKTMTLAEALGKAGGVTDGARLRDLQIIRTTADNKSQVLKIDARDPEVQARTLVQAGDNIVIPHSAPNQHVDFLTFFGTILGLRGIIGGR